MRRDRANPPSQSVVVPVFNEQQNLQELVSRIKRALVEIGPYEIVLIDDGSTDETPLELQQLCKQNHQIKGVFLSRNFGHQAAVSAGLEHSSGDIVFVMDGDLQDPPEVLPLFLDKWYEGFDVVYGVRKKRPENIFKKTAYFLFYRLLRRTAEIDIPLDSGDFSLMDRVVVDKLNSLPERNRFVRGIRAWIGYRQLGVEYVRESRFAGSSKYSFAALIKLGYDGIFSFSKKPLLIATRLGILVTVSAFLFALYSFIQKMLYDSDPQGWASTIIIVLFLGGVQLLVLGVLGEYVARISDEVKGRPIYVVDKLLNFSIEKDGRGSTEAGSE